MNPLVLPKEVHDQVKEILTAFVNLEIFYKDPSQSLPNNIDPIILRKYLKYKQKTPRSEQLKRILKEVIHERLSDRLISPHKIYTSEVLLFEVLGTLLNHHPIRIEASDA